MKTLPSNGLERGLIILEYLEAVPHGQTNSEISRTFGIATSTCTYILSRLEKRGYLTRDEKGRYRIGSMPITLANGALRGIGFWSTAEPALYRLVEETGVSASIGILERDHILIVDRVEGPEVRQEVASFSETRLRSSAMLGRREERYIGKEMPVHSNAIGKAILANLPRAVTLRILKEQGLPSTRRTITSRTGLLNQLDLYHAQGYACSMEEQHEGIHGLAVHLTDSNGTVRAAIGLTPTVEQARSELKDLHLSALRRAAQSISKRARFQQ